MSKERKTEQRGGGAEHRVREARGFNRVSGAVNGLCRRALSSVRLSLSFRISIHYALQLMRTWLREILLVSLVFCAVSGTLLYAVRLAHHAHELPFVGCPAGREQSRSAPDRRTSRWSGSQSRSL